MKPTFAQYAHFYLNTGLKVQIFGVDQMWFEHEFDEEDLKDGTEWTLSGLNDPKLSFENGEAVPFLLTRNETSWIGIEARNFKPMMCPLSSLTKEITVDGETFVPLERLTEMYADTVNGFHMDINARFPNTEYKFTLMQVNRKEWTTQAAVPFEAYQQLLKWHVNIFNMDPSEFIEINESKTP